MCGPARSSRLATRGAVRACHVWHTTIAMFVHVVCTASTSPPCRRCRASHGPCVHGPAVSRVCTCNPVCNFHRFPPTIVSEQRADLAVFAMQQQPAGDACSRGLAHLALAPLESIACKWPCLYGFKQLTCNCMQANAVCVADLCMQSAVVVAGRHHPAHLEPSRRCQPDAALHVHYVPMNAKGPTPCK